MIENIDSLVAMMEAATESMTGKCVKINLREPIRKGLAGHVYQNMEGEYIMDLSPALTLKQFYLTWLHETGHIFESHIEKQGKTIFEGLPSGFFEEFEQEQISEYKEQPDEIAADSFRDSLNHYAQQKAMDLFFEDGIQTRIRVLTKISIRSGEKQ
jgi:hypothetical protein